MTDMITFLRKLFTSGPEAVETQDYWQRPIEKFESLMLANMNAEPQKWFVDYTAGSQTLRAVNREKGVAVAVEGVESDRDGFLRQDGYYGRAFCGRANLTAQFTASFRIWAITEFNQRHQVDLDREHQRVSDAISEAFK